MNLPRNCSASSLHLGVETNRRSFLNGLGMGFAGLAMGSLLASDGVLRAGETDREADASRFALPRPRAIIWIFLVGGMSQMESFDPKPELNKYAGKTIDETPYKATLESPHLKKNLREVIEGLHKVHPKIYPMQVGYRKYGQSGLEMSDWWPRTGELCADDLCLVRSMWTTDNNHGAQLQFHTGRHSLEGPFPTIGSWVHYGLGSLNDNLPQFVVLGTPIADCCGGVQGARGELPRPRARRHSARRRSEESAAVRRARTQDVFQEEQAGEFDLLGRLNRLAGGRVSRRPGPRGAASSRTSWPSGCRPRCPTSSTSPPNRPRRTSSTASTTPATKTFGGQCLAARRLVERGVRFVQLFHGSNGGAGAWDAHGGPQERATASSAARSTSRSPA